MCAIIGITGKVKTDLIKKLFIESQVRGRHATGVSYYKGGKVYTIRESVPAEQFVEIQNPSDWFEDENITMIGHCRYSTSDLEYNQPIAKGNRSLVHNGVITQEEPYKWAQMYGYQCEGKNDTELLFESWDAEVWSDSSIACIFLEDDKMKWTRNGRRPMWITKTEHATIITSTKDIAVRAGLKNPVRVDYEGKDLQP